MKNNKGITLIALVITIIVLLILAGVAIAMLTGENSILTRSTDTRYAMEIAKAKDEISLKVNEYAMEYFEERYVNDDATAKTQTLQEAILAKVKAAKDKKLTDANVAVSINESTAAITVTANDRTDIKTVGTFDATTGALTWKDSFNSTIKVTP